MTETADIVIYLVYPLCTLGIIGIVKYGVVELKNMQKDLNIFKIEICQRLSVVETKMESRRKDD